MTDYNSVLSQLVAITGCSEQDAVKYEGCINSSIEYVRSMLIDEENENDVRIVNLCAVSAAIKLALLNEMNSDDIVSFKAGDVSFTKGSSPLKRLELLQKLALNECASLLRSGGFAFKVV